MPPPPTPVPPTEPVSPPADPSTTLAKAVLVHSAPTGAEIFLNGIPIGKRTPDVLQLSARVRIEVRRDGYLPGVHDYLPGQDRVVFRLEKARSSSPQTPPGADGRAATKTPEKVRVDQLPDWARKLQKSIRQEEPRR
jgi:hypothetical protein